MRIGPSLILASRQTLAMTPQLQQAIKLLQFSHLELAAFIQQELEKNPLLQETSADEGPIAEREAPPPEAPTDTAEALAAAAPALAEAMGTDLATVERVWARLRQIEPAGLFARSLAECLGAQLAERDRLDPAMKALLDNLDLVAAGELGQLRRRCSVDDEDLRDMLAELRTLDPRPGQKFDFEPIQPVAPDLFLTPAKDAETGEEGWYIELNTDALPKVLVDRNYHATLMKGARRKTDRDFVAERFQSANWLVKTLEQRATTILKVAREIVRQQDGFFRKGVSALRPRVLRDIAVATELHESTVSRVTSNKYIATPRGIFELKYFFTSALPARTPGVVVSSESVRSRIRHLVGGENSSQPLSDDRIVDLLKGEGVEIARRTVAKYREAMRIPSSAERRRLGRLGLGRSPPSGVPSAAIAVQLLAGPAD